MADTIPYEQHLKDAVLNGDAAAAARLATDGLAAGVPPRALLDHGLIAAMGEAGRLFESGEYFVPELLVSARAMKAAMAVLDPALVGQARSSAGRIAIGTVAGDLHDIGKNLVATMLRGSGFEVDDLGVDVTPGQFVDAARAGASVIGVSSLLTTTMVSMGAVVSAIEQAGLRGRVKVMVGGAPVNKKWADEIGADGWAQDAVAAVDLATRLAAF